MTPTRRGFSLLEVIVALLIVSMFFVPMLSNMVSLRRQGYESRNLVVATNLAQATLEGLRTLARQRLARPEPLPPAAPIPASLSAELAEGATRFTRVPAVRDVVSGGRLVGMRLATKVAWPMPGETRPSHQLELATLVFAERD